MFETLRELSGRYLKISLSLKKATGLPEKYTFKTMSRYEWIDEGRTTCESQVVNDQREPNFAYTGEHIEQITDEFVSLLMYNTLTIKILGMIKSKKKPQKTEYEREAYQSDYVSEAPERGYESSSSRQQSAQESGQKQGKSIRKSESDVVSDLQKQNEALLRQLEEARAN